MAAMGQPYRFKIRTVADALSATDTDGAALALTDLIFDPSTPFLLQCRPASQEIVTPAMFGAAGYNTSGFISIHYELGTRIYGMIAGSGAYFGYDVPFCYDTATSAFVTISGFTVNNLPQSPAVTGAWTPPQMQQVGGRIMLTHPGFTGGASGLYVGWFDISATTVSPTGVSYNGSATLENLSSVSGITVGMSVSGAGIPSSTVVTAISGTGASAPSSTAGTTSSGSSTVQNVTLTTAMAAGQTISGAGIPAGTIISSFAVSSLGGPFSAVGNTVSGSPQIAGFSSTSAAVGMTITGSGVPASATITAITAAGSPIQFQATEVSGSTLLTNVSNAAQVLVGQSISGAGIASGTTATSVASAGAGPYTTTCNTTSGSTIITNLSSTAGMAAGQDIAGPAIANGTTIVSVTGGSAGGSFSGKTVSGQAQMGVLSNISLLSVGQLVSGAGIPAGTLITGLVQNSTGFITIMNVVSGYTYLFSNDKLGVGMQLSGTSPFFVANVIAVNADQVTLDAAVPSPYYGSPNHIAVTNASISLSAAATSSASGTYTAAGNTAVLSQAAASSLSGTGIVFGGGRITLSQAATASGTTVNMQAQGGSSITISGNCTATASGVTLTFGGSTITLSQAATASAGNVALQYGGGSVTLSNTATSSNTGATYTFQGGSGAAPVWSAGNTSGNPLPSPPVAVGLFNGRAYYGCGNLLYYSDSGFPTQMTNSNQALTVGDNTSITCMSPLPMTTSLQGIIQALIVGKGNSMWQVTGDAAGGTTVSGSTITVVSTLALNTMNVESGCIAPRTMASTPQGVAYAGQDGIRIIQPSGAVSDALPYIRVPFINATTPSRLCAAASQYVYRICGANAAAPGGVTQDWWWDNTQQAWNGPHSFTYDCIGQIGNTFIMSRYDIPSSLWSSTSQQYSSSGFTENGNPMSFNLLTAPMGEEEWAGGNSCDLSTLDYSLPPQPYILNILANDERGNTLATGYIASTLTQAQWDSATWDQSLWAGPAGSLLTDIMPFNNSLVFNRLQVNITGPSGFGLRIGPMKFDMRPLRYVPPAFTP